MKRDRKEEGRKYRLKYREKLKKMRRFSYEKYRDKALEQCKRYYQQNKDKVQLYQKQWGYKQKEIVFDHYGNRCSCCGETEVFFLCIDHINNDGNTHRKLIRGRATGTNMYRWIIRNNFPADLQTLCQNCNWGKYRNGGVCPHKSNSIKGILK